MAPEEKWSNKKVVMSHLHVLDAVFSFACLVNREINGIQQTESWCTLETLKSPERTAYFTL